MFHEPLIFGSTAGHKIKAGATYTNPGVEEKIREALATYILEEEWDDIEQIAQNTPYFNSARQNVCTVP